MKVRSLRWRFYRKAGGPRHIGNRCKVYCPGCVVCESHRWYLETGRFPSFDEAHEAGDRHAAGLADGEFGEIAWSELRPK